MFRDGKPYTRLMTLPIDVQNNTAVHRIDGHPGAANPQNLPAQVFFGVDPGPVEDWYIIRGQLVINNMSLPGVKNTVVHVTHDADSVLSGILHWQPFSDGDPFGGWWSVTFAAIGLS